MPVHNRVKDLIGRLTLQEKIRLLVNNAAGVPRLGISGYEWWSEALHGVSNVGPGTRFGGHFPGATIFPRSSSPPPPSTPPSGRHRQGGVRRGPGHVQRGAGGADLLEPQREHLPGPTVGRGQETPGEDPLVAGRYAASYVRGLQQPYGYEANRLKVAACCKHYTAYDLDNWKGADRFHFNARVTKQDLEDTFNVPFKRCVMEGKVASVMCSYNQVDGVPTCWELNGYIVSDCDSVGVFYNSQHYASTPEDAAADAIKAGLDLDCGPFLAQHTEGAVNYALANTLTVQMRLGMFDGEPSEQPFGKLGPSDVCSPAHQKRPPCAPLSASRFRTVAVVGPNSVATATMIGNYGIGRYARTIHQPGCNNVPCAGNQPIDAAVTAARESDATILVMGLDQSQEAEMKDRENLLLPGRQQELVSKVASASRGPTVLVLMSGGPLDVTFANNNPKVAAILWVGYPGQAGGRPSPTQIHRESHLGFCYAGGKLPTTWYPEEFAAKVPMTDMAMRADPANGYPAGPTGSTEAPYTSFSHSIAHAPTAISVNLAGRRGPAQANSTTGRLLSAAAVRVTHARCDELAMDVLVDVENTGDRDGAHAVLLFASPPGGHRAPFRQLVAFEKLHVQAQSRARVRLGIDVCKDLSFADANGIRRIPIGEHTLHIGDQKHTFSIHAAAPGL
ncbi:unnamed protein product [Spirodela intermedia]|uniref:Fibronectin type III-like domain-containing protein n=1 Tax=Spirodela intermedia TaxID=51605 RepID=A0A7I8I9P1_SPIIN|nr:unnamed protein product [Spirodela intermedia]CAA6654385.1 unnamed protein product [Spirodela intermedia]